MRQFNFSHEPPTADQIHFVSSLDWGEPYCEVTDPITLSRKDRLLKGRNEEWGNLRLPFFHARIGKLFDRDYVWVVTQTMVSFENLALWTVHSVLTNKVYPGFWGRRLLTFKVYPGFWGRRSVMDCKTCVPFIERVWKCMVTRPWSCS